MFEIKSTSHTDNKSLLSARGVDPTKGVILMVQTTTTSSKKQFSDIEKRAAKDADFPLSKARKAIRALGRRIKLAGGDVELTLTEDKWWAFEDKPGEIRERMFCCVYVLYNSEYVCDEAAIKSMIVILGNRFKWLTFPILRQIASN